MKKGHLWHRIVMSLLLVLFYAFCLSIPIQYYDYWCLTWLWELLVGGQKEDHHCVYTHNSGDNNAMMGSLFMLERKKRHTTEERRTIIIKRTRMFGWQFQGIARFASSSSQPISHGACDHPKHKLYAARSEIRESFSEDEIKVQLDLFSIIEALFYDLLSNCSPFVFQPFIESPSRWMRTPN